MLDINDMDLKTNPILDKNLFSGDGSLITSNGELYKPGNYLWNKYNGEYHTHYNGQICAGSHDTNTINPDRLLFHKGNENNIRYSTDDEFKFKKATDESISEINKSNLPENTKNTLINELLKLENSGPISIKYLEEFKIPYTKRKKTYTRLNRNEGCTNPYAKNYDIESTTDDGSCEYLWNVFPLTFKMEYEYSDDEELLFSYVTLHGNGRFTTGDIKFCDGTYEISDFDTLHTGFHSFRMEFWENDDTGGRTTLEATWDGDVYRGFEGTRIKHDGTEGVFRVKPGWFHAPLFGTPGYYGTKSITNMRMDLPDTNNMYLQMDDGYRKPKYNKRWWNLVGGVTGTGISGGDYEIDMHRHKFKMVYDRASDSSCEEAGQQPGCRTVIVANLTPIPMWAESSPSGESVGGYYNEIGGYNVPTWAHSFIIANDNNVNGLCGGCGSVGNAEIIETRYVSSMYGSQYESAWNCEGDSWVEYNHPDSGECPNDDCSGYHAIYLYTCDPESDLIENVDHPLKREDWKYGITNAKKRKWNGELYEIEDVWNSDSLYFEIQKSSSYLASVNKEYGIESTAINNLNQQNCETNMFFPDEPIDWANCECTSPNNITCPTGYVYDFKLDYCVYDCPEHTEWNGLFSNPQCISTGIGDLNNDGVVNVVDIVNLVGIIMSGTEVYGDQFRRADINGDGIINVVDVVGLVLMVLSRNDISELERQQLNIMLKQLQKSSLSLGYVLRKSLDLIDKNVIDGWVCPKYHKTLSHECVQMKPQEQILWNEYSYWEEKKKQNGKK